MKLVGAYIDNWSNYRDQHSILEMSSFIESARPGEDMTKLQQFLVEFLPKDPYNARLLLYLPFWAMQNPSKEMFQVVRDAFFELLRYHDVRENFNLGDCYELDARPEKLDRVVKVIHLVPWLLKFGYLEECDVVKCVAKNNKDAIFCRSILDVLPFLIERDSLGMRPNSFLETIQILASGNADRSAQKPVYNSAKRQAWLDEMNQHHDLKLTNVTGPFYWNIKGLDLSVVEQELSCSRDRIIRIGGSRIKGYGRNDSDLDLYPIRKGDNPSRDPGLAYIVFNTIWAGESRKVVENEQKRHAEAMMDAAKDPIVRRQILEKLEQDLLQYRLMHKGFPYAYGNISEETCSFSEMNGASAFYDDRYRRAATQLFLKYVFLP